MAGHMGDERVTTQNLKVVSSDEDRGLILIRGAVPGSRGEWVLVSDAIKKAMPESAPFPAALLKGSSRLTEEIAAAVGLGPEEDEVKETPADDIEGGDADEAKD